MYHTLASLYIFSFLASKKLTAEMNLLSKQLKYVTFYLLFLHLLNLFFFLTLLSFPLLEATLKMFASWGA